MAYVQSAAQYWMRIMLEMKGYHLVNSRDRATFNITHDALGVMISKSEAERIEKERTQSLLKEKKLSLLLDLDQTVIHATVDPTIGTWLNDPNNANFPLLNDVYSFILPEKGNPIVYYIKVITLMLN